MTGQRCRLALIGWGAINRRVAGLITSADLPVEFVAVAVRDAGRPRDPLPKGAVLIDRPADLVACGPDLVVEAAGKAALCEWAAPVLDSGATLICASMSAFTDDALLPRLAALAEAHGSRIELVAGAIGGVDAIRAAAEIGVEEVVHRVSKPPAAWRGTAAEQLIDLDAVTVPAVIFSGSAREGASLFPQNANATVTTALAGIGLDRTRVEVVVDPAATLNRHEITLRGAAGRQCFVLENAPSVENPKSSDLTALSVLRAIRNHVSPVRL